MISFVFSHVSYEHLGLRVWGLASLLGMPWSMIKTYYKKV